MGSRTRVSVLFRRRTLRAPVTCVASVSVWFWSKELPRNGDPCSLLWNRMKTLSTQASVLVNLVSSRDIYHTKVGKGLIYMIPECRLSFWNKFIPSPYLCLYLFTFLSHTSHSTMSSRFSVRIKFSFWYKISFWYHVSWKRALFRIENRKRVLSGEWGMRIWSGAKTTRVRTPRLSQTEPFMRYELHSGT